MPESGPRSEDAVGPSDGLLIEQARRGDHDAYAALVRRYQDVGFRTAYLITRSAPDAEDATQEALVKAYRALAGFRSGAPFRPWLLKIVANEARNRRRAIGRRRDAVSLDGPAGDTRPVRPEPVDPTLAVEDQLVASERRAGLRSALRGLSDDDRQVIALRWFLDLSESEMAAVIGVARGTVKSRLSRAMGRLREQLLEGHPDA